MSRDLPNHSGDFNAGNPEAATHDLQPALANGAVSSAEDLAQGRRGPDRRVQETPRLSKWTLGSGRRRNVRREEEREGSFVDQHGMRLWYLVLWVAMMNVGDSYFTLVHLQNGGIEVNPIAQELLGTGRFWFVFVKSSLIGIALVVLAIHKNFYLARVGIFVSAATYTLLVIYHLMLFRLG
ncbi:MAG: hypothetical protein ACI8QS_001187 [Planctomycetota bacterium]|jgi:hypothetical protein